MKIDIDSTIGEPRRGEEEKKEGRKGDFVSERETGRDREREGEDSKYLNSHIEKKGHSIFYKLVLFSLVKV